MALPDSRGEASLRRGAMIYKASMQQIHAYCSEKDMYHLSQMSLQCVGSSE